MVAGDNCTTGALKASPTGGPDGPALTAPPRPPPRFLAEVFYTRAPACGLTASSDPNIDIDFVEGS
jgi:hypothetical protein